MWSTVDFGKWAGKGKTLPQIIVADPDWFFWGIEEGIFKGPLAAEAKKLARRATAIKMPPTYTTHCVQYMLSHQGKFSGFNVIPIAQPAHLGSSTEIRRPHLDLSAPRSLQKYDKLGGRLMMPTFKYYWFSNKNFTKQRLEDFFDDASNFLKP